MLSLTIFQALAYAGDLTINANRKIKLVREDSKTREISEIDLTDSKIPDENKKLTQTTPKNILINK